MNFSWNSSYFKPEIIPNQIRNIKDEKKGEDDNIVEEESGSVLRSDEMPEETPNITMSAGEALAIVNKATVRGAMGDSVDTTEKIKKEGLRDGSQLEDLIAQWDNLPENESYENKLALLNDIIELCSGDEDLVRIWRCRRVLLMAEHFHEITDEILSDNTIDWDTFNYAGLGYVANIYSEFLQIRDYYLNMYSIGSYDYDQYNELLIFMNAGIEMYSSLSNYYQIMQNKPGIDPSVYEGHIANMSAWNNNYNVWLDDLQEHPVAEPEPEPEEPNVNPWDDALSTFWQLRQQLIDRLNEPNGGNILIYKNVLIVQIRQVLNLLQELECPSYEHAVDDINQIFEDHNIPYSI